MLSDPGSNIASSASETWREAASDGVYIETVLIPSFFAVLIIRTAIYGVHVVSQADAEKRVVYA